MKKWIKKLLAPVIREVVKEEIEKSFNSHHVSTPMYESEKSNSPAIGRFFLNRQDVS